MILFDHDMTVAAASDWVIDVDPGAGDDDGRIVASGPRAKVAASPQVAPYPIVRALGQLAGPAV